MVYLSATKAVPVLTEDTHESDLPLRLRLSVLLGREISLSEPMDVLRLQKKTGGHGFRLEPFGR